MLDRNNLNTDNLNPHLDLLIQRIRHARKIADETTTIHDLKMAIQSLNDKDAIEFLSNPYLSKYYEGQHILTLASGVIGRVKIVDALIADNITYMNNNSAPLIASIEFNRPDVTALLLKNHMKINSSDESTGLTPLIAAIRANNIIAICLLSMKGAQPDFANHLGVTATHEAAKSSNIKLLQTLLLNHADVNVSDFNGITPLNLAAIDDSRIIHVKELLIYGAEANLNKDGFTYLLPATNNVSKSELDKLIKLYQKFQDIKSSCVPAFNSISALNEKLRDQDRHVLYGYMEEIAKLEVFLVDYQPTDLSRINQKLELRSIMKLLYSYINNPENNDDANIIKGKIAAFNFDVNKLMVRIKQDHLLNGTLTMFGTKSRLATNIEEAIAPVMKMGMAN